MREVPQPGKQSVSGTPSSQNQAVVSYQVARFQQQLQHFMQQPMDGETERRFAAALMQMRFFVPMQMLTQNATPKRPNERLGMALASITYLADGQKYIPVFTEQSALKTFLVNQFTNVNLRSVELTVSEVMVEAKSLKTSGILINPGQQNFPLANDYWHYINQVVPLIPERAEDYELELLTPTPEKLMTALQKAFRHQHRIKAAWLVGLKMPAEIKYEMALIVKYQGDLSEFQVKVAPKLAIISHRYQEYGTDLLIGTTKEAVGQAVVKMLDPFYQRRHFWQNE